jgi:ribosomal protein S18 acetylase RimI-like enzyme
MRDGIERRYSIDNKGRVLFYRVKDIATEDFNEAIKIYDKSFPLSEKHTCDSVKEDVANGIYELIVGRHGEEVVFMALFWPIPETNFILFDYMAVKEEYRNMGIGSMFMENIFNILDVDRKYLILEVENPDYGQDGELKRKRINFYRRYGARIMKDVRYILPPLSGGTSTEMVLMIMPEYGNGKIQGRIVKDIIRKIYKELPGRDKNDFYLDLFIHNIPPIIELDENSYCVKTML